MANTSYPFARSSTEKSGLVIEAAAAVIREYISDSAGIAELPAPRDGELKPAIFFHASVVYVPDPLGNPYGPPVRAGDAALQQPNVMRRSLPIGTTVLVNAHYVQSPFFAMQATTLWPTTTQDPRIMRPAADQAEVLANYHREARLEGLVGVVFDGLDSREMIGYDAVVEKFVDRDFGIIELKMPGHFVQVLFHRESVYLRDGKRAIDLDFFRDKDISDMVSNDESMSVLYFGENANFLHNFNLPSTTFL